MIVVSNERENEFEQERENESSENAKENQTRRREEPLPELYQPKMKNFRNKNVMPSRNVNSIKILILCWLGVESHVKFFE